MLSFVNCRILVIGDIILDVYMDTQVKRISPEAPVPVAHVHRQWSTLGGAANVARNLICLGCNVTLIGICGHDDSGKHLQRLLTSYGIKHKIILANDRPTSTKTRILSQGQQLLRIDDEVCFDFSYDIIEKTWDTIKNCISGMSAVILSDYNKGIFRKLSNNDSLSNRIINHCKKIKIPVLVDPKGSDWDRYTNADCITPNTNELSEILNTPPELFTKLKNGAFDLIEQYNFSRILLTRSEKGMALLQPKSDCIKIPTQAREVSDVSGAGDTVIAVLSACIAKGMDWLPAARIANIAAGIVVSKLGTSPIELSELREAIGVHEGWNKNLSRISTKILTLDCLKLNVESWHQKGKKIVFTNGCFDLLHMGHIQLLEEAAAQGDKLIVALNSDNSIRRLKGEGRPIQSEKARAVVLAALSVVDAVILFDELTPLHLIREISPDVLVKGGDYTIQSVVGAEHVMSYGGRVHLANFVDGYSTTKIINTFTSEK